MKSLRKVGTATAREISRYRVDRDGAPAYPALPFTCAVAICACVGGWEFFRGARLRVGSRRVNQPLEERRLLALWLRLRPLLDRHAERAAVEVGRRQSNRRVGIVGSARSGIGDHDDVAAVDRGPAARARESAGRGRDGDRLVVAEAQPERNASSSSRCMHPSLTSFSPKSAMSLSHQRHQRCDGAATPPAHAIDTISNPAAARRVGR